MSNNGDLTGMLCIGEIPTIPNPNDIYNGWKSYGIAIEPSKGDVDEVVESFKKHLQEERTCGANGQPVVQGQRQGETIYLRVKRQDYQDMEHGYHIEMRSGIPMVQTGCVLDTLGLSQDDDKYAEFTKAHPTVHVVRIQANPEGKYGAESKLKDFLDQLPVE